MKKTYLFLIVNIGLWLYTIDSLIKILVAPKNTLDTQLKSVFSSTNNWFSEQWAHVSHFIFDWKTLVFILLAITLAVLMIKFWNITFMILGGLTLLIAVWVAYYVVNGHFILGNYYPLIILVISLGNIWLSAKASNL